MKSGSDRPWEERVTSAGAKLRDDFQQELARVVRYIDEEVVPEVRRNSSSALRAAAERMEKLARHMDESSKPDPSDADRTAPGPR